MNETTQKNRCPFFSRVQADDRWSAPIPKQTDPARQIHGCGGRAVNQITKGKEVSTWIRLPIG